MTASPMVRRDARDTEIAAAAAVERRLTESHALIRAAFNREGPMTDERLEQLPEFSDWGPSSARKRRSELMMAGELVAVGDARNSRGRTMVLWGLKVSQAPGSPAVAGTSAPADRSPPASRLPEPVEPRLSRTIMHGDRVRILGTRELGEVIGIENPFEPAFARRYQVHRSVDLFTAHTSWHDADELELA